MTWGAIATWRMAHDGLLKLQKNYNKEVLRGTAVEQLIKEVEDYPFYKSVGYGGFT